MNLDHLARQYLMASYLYYQKDVSIMDDSSFDKLCGTLKDNFKDIPERYKGETLINESGLEAGTGFHIVYPLIIQHASMAWFKHLANR